MNGDVWLFSGRLVASGGEVCDDGKPYSVATAHGDGIAGDVERAEFIARACNAYPALVEANTLALAALEAMWSAYMSDRHPNLEQINDAMKALRATTEPTP